MSSKPAPDGPVESPSTAERSNLSDTPDLVNPRPPTDYSLPRLYSSEDFIKETTSRREKAVVALGIKKSGATRSPELQKVDEALKSQHELRADYDAGLKQYRDAASRGADADRSGVVKTYNDVIDAFHRVDAALTKWGPGHERGNLPAVIRLKEAIAVGKDSTREFKTYLEESVARNKTVPLMSTFPGTYSSVSRQDRPIQPAVLGPSGGACTAAASAEPRQS
jgi:hypothetical protein